MSKRVSVGFVGVGNMGTPMVSRLAAAGYAVTAFDADPERRRRIPELGAASAESLAEVASAATVVFLSLPTPEIVEQVVTGAGGILDHAAEGTAIVDMSTVDPATARAVGEACAGRGVDFLDAPVSGGVQAAEAGALTLMAGGDEDVLTRVRPLLETFAGNIVHVGAIGDAQVAKLCNNMLAAIHSAALGEVLVTGVKCGLGFDRLYQVISKSSGSSAVLTSYFPVTVLTDERPARFTVDLMQKDIGLFQRAARYAGCPAPLAALAQSLFDVLRAEGGGGKDATSIVEFYERLAGVRLAWTEKPAEVKA